MSIKKNVDNVENVEKSFKWLKIACLSVVQNIKISTMDCEELSTINCG